MKTKKCSKCGEGKPLEGFSRDKSSKDGLRVWCKGCVSQYVKDRAKRRKEEGVNKVPDHKECVICKKTLPSSSFDKDYNRRDFIRNECRKCNRASQRETYHKDIGSSRRRVREVARKAYSTPEGRDRLRENAYRWARNNPEKFKAIQHSRRAENIGKMDPEKWSSRLDYYGGKCVYCGTDENITIEHRIPVSRGGTNLSANLVPACKSCNCSKGTKTETEYKLLLSQEHAE